MIDAIYSDFDGTITKRDTVNTFLQTYADPAWIDSEKSWLEGRITSRENAIIQVGLIRPMTEKVLDDYIASIELDDGFLDFYRYVNRQNIPLTILSDGFDLFISRTLERHGIGNVRFYANHLIRRDDGFGIEFPHFTESCRIGSGLCKCSKIAEENHCYIGDGATDLCVARNAKLLFASKYLAKHCKENDIRHIPFNDFGDITDCLIKMQTMERR